MPQIAATDSRKLPHIIKASQGSRDLRQFLSDRREQIEGDLATFGALLFRGFDVFSTQLFDAAMRAVSSKRLEYVYRSTPRTSLGDGVFTATEYPPEESIGLHSENAYQRQWPTKIAFCCLVPAVSGGETPIADVRRVTARLNPELLERFEKKRVRYVRHYHPYIDLPWQTVFQVTDKRALANFCARADIHCEWLDEDILRTEQVCQGTAIHPITNEKLWFNQAHLFHSSALSRDVEEALVGVFGRERLPRNAYFGDGEEIPIADLDAVRRVFWEEAMEFSWQPGDVLLLDNMQVAHGRKPFKGERKIVAALLDPYDASAVLGLRASAVEKEDLCRAR
ncbi:MAG TPA: TauD/TfdA family dioxygenase [Steroidobacteraceae bacterium]|nr:TauD/TfdA family dioxygenase [Steroidobacteraceae bacterium]